EEAAAHVQALRPADRSPVLASPPHGLDAVPPLDRSEERALSYGALYHPWPTLAPADAPGTLRRTPPDGVVAGVFAKRAATRGAWVAPANEAFLDVVALTPPIAPSAYPGLAQAQVNVLRHDPGSFLVLAADTLLDADDLRPVNVRRLLSLLRRYALLHG